MTAVPRPSVVGTKPVVLVAMCNGQRCAALRHLHDTPAGGSVADGGGASRDHSESEDLLRQAIRDRPEAVLVSVPCLGPCGHASVAVIGPGVAGDGQLTWVGRPMVLGLTDDSERARALAGWITSTAPDVGTLPATLRSTA